MLYFMIQLRYGASCTVEETETNQVFLKSKYKKNVSQYYLRRGKHSGRHRNRIPKSKPVMRTVRQACEFHTTNFYLNQKKARTSCHAALLAFLSADLFVHFPFFFYILSAFYDTFSGAYFFHLRQSVRFASVRSRVRSPSCPPRNTIIPCE